MKLRNISAVLLSVLLLMTCLPLGAASVSAAVSGTTGDCAWTLDGTRLTISGNGAMADYSYLSMAPWGKEITEVVIAKGVTYIGDDAFSFCYKIKEVFIPDTVTAIGSGVFNYCTSLSRITVDPENALFYSSGNCIIRKDIKTLVAGCNASMIPDGVVAIGAYAMSGCTFQSIDIPEGVRQIDSWAFSRSDMTAITIPKTLTDIDTNAFYLCNALTDVYYSGNKLDRAKISVAENNTALTNATWHYAPCENDTHVYAYACATICQNCDNRRIEEVTHTYEDDCDAQCDICGESREVKHQFVRVGENVATCQHCSFSKTFDFIMTTHEVLTVSYEATRDFDFVVEDIGVAKIGDISSSVIAVGSYYRKSSSAQVLPVCPGETKIQGVSADGKILTSAGLLVVEGDHVYDDEYDADCNVCDATREVPEKPVETIYGDCNGDGEINNRDLALLQQYLNFWDVTIYASSGDANNDGEVNNRDLALLQQFLNNWDVTLG